MYMAKMEKGGSSGQPAAGIERFVMVLEGEVEVTHDQETLTLGANHYAYFPANATGRCEGQDEMGRG